MVQAALARLCLCGPGVEGSLHCQRLSYFSPFRMASEIGTVVRLRRRAKVDVGLCQGGLHHRPPV